MTRHSKGLPLSFLRKSIVTSFGRRVHPKLAERVRHFLVRFDEAPWSCRRETCTKKSTLVVVRRTLVPDNQVNMSIGTSISDVISVSSHPSKRLHSFGAIEASECSRMACLLAEDLISSRILKDSRPPVNHHAMTLRRTVDEVSHKHLIVFSSIVKRLGPLDEDSLPGVFVNVCREMLSDEHLNWGRVVSIFAFAAALAQHFSSSPQDSHLVPTVTRLLAEFVSQDLTSWIVKQGGWDAFDRYFPEPNGVENSIWKGLLYTFVGLGALASVVAAR